MMGTVVLPNYVSFLRIGLADQLIVIPGMKRHQKLCKEHEIAEIKFFGECHTWQGIFEHRSNHCNVKH